MKEQKRKERLNKIVRNILGWALFIVLVMVILVTAVSCTQDTKYENQCKALGYNGFMIDGARGLSNNHNVYCLDKVETPLPIIIESMQ